jgi:endoglucanase
MTPWFLLEARGGRVMVGEFGAYRETPHDVVLRWMEDMLANWKDAGWGWALWEFRGSFGVLDSGRKDVEYEDFQGHKLDRKMLELLQRY